MMNHDSMLNIGAYAKDKYDAVYEIKKRYGEVRCEPRYQLIVLFTNHYGASIINYGYGNAENPFEMALLYDGELTYDGDNFTDVAGWLDMNDCMNLLDEIAKME